MSRMSGRKGCFQLLPFQIWMGSRSFLVVHLLQSNVEAHRWRSISPNIVQPDGLPSVANCFKGFSFIILPLLFDWWKSRIMQILCSYPFQVIPPHLYAFSFSVDFIFPRNWVYYITRKKLRRLLSHRKSPDQAYQTAYGSNAVPYVEFAYERRRSQCFPYNYHPPCTENKPKPHKKPKCQSESLCVKFHSTSSFFIIPAPQLSSDGFGNVWYRAQLILYKPRNDAFLSSSVVLRALHDLHPGHLHPNMADYKSRILTCHDNRIILCPPGRHKQQRQG